MKRLFLIVAAALSIAACSSTRYVAKDVPPIDEMALVLPYSRIYEISKEGEKYDPVRSAKQQNKLTQLLFQMEPRIKGTIDVEGARDQEACDRYIESLRLVNPRHIEDFPAYSPISGMIEKRGFRYGMIIYSDGFVKDRKLYRKEVLTSLAVDVAAAILTGGEYYVGADSWLYGSSLYVLVLDVVEDKVVFYNRIDPAERNPMNSDVLASQLKRLLKKMGK
ncbi:MAG: hypothetical protein J6037_01295 [Bacteroidales bacterium]|nr:hypothetical protein [Bacteroidales bacterium]